MTLDSNLSPRNKILNKNPKAIGTIDYNSLIPLCKIALQMFFITLCQIHRFATFQLLDMVNSQI